MLFRSALSVSSTVIIVSNNSFSNGVTVYPNPYRNSSSGGLHIRFKNMPNGQYQIRILNTLGQVIYNKTDKIIENQEYYDEDFILTDLTKSLGSGLYYMEIISTFNNQKIVKPIFIN